MDTMNQQIETRIPDFISTPTLYSELAATYIAHQTVHQLLMYYAWVYSHSYSYSAE